MIALDPDVEDAIRDLAEQTAPIERQHVRLPSPPPIDTQPTRLASHPPPLPPEMIGEHLPTVEFVTNPAVVVAIEGGMGAVKQLCALQQRLAEVETTLRRLARDIHALKDHLLMLEPHAARAPKLRALITTSLRTCDLALAAAGER